MAYVGFHFGKLSPSIQLRWIERERDREREREKESEKERVREAAREGGEGREGKGGREREGGSSGIFNHSPGRIWLWVKTP